MKKTLVSAFALSFMVSGAIAPAQARGGGEFVAGTIIGGALGLFAGSAHRPPPPPPRRHYVSPAQRENNRAIQRRLNYFGYNAGIVDGVLGRRSRQAILAFQYDAGFKQTGYLTDEQAGYLFSRQFEDLRFGVSQKQDNQSDVEESASEESAGKAEKEQEIFWEEENSAKDAGKSEEIVVFEEDEEQSDPVSGLGLSEANTKLEFEKGDPSILGIGLGQDYASAKQVLEDNGYHNCAGEGEFIACSIQQDGVSRDFKLARGAKLSDQPLYLMDLTTKLNVDVDQSMIETKVAEAYPELVAAPHRIIANSQQCAATMSDIGNVDSLVQKLEILRDQDGANNDWLKATLRDCQLFYKADIAHGADGYTIRIVLFDGSYLQNVLSVLDKKTIDKVNEALKF